MISERPPPRQAGRGVYGFKVAGLDEAALLGPADAGWPRLSVIRTAPEDDPGSTTRPAGTVLLDDERAAIWLADGDRIEVERATLTVRFVTRRRVDDEHVVHPYLALPAAIASRWIGRQGLHGGAFCHSGRAWALLASKEGGKSSTLARLLRRGHRILSDDLLVVDGGHVFAGPRCVDLRADAAAVLGGEDLGVVGGRVRWRLHAGEAPASMPLAGLVFLEWGEQVLIEPMDAEARLTGLVANRVVYPGPDESAAYLDLVSLPAWRLVRPRNLDALDRVNAQLLEALA